MTPSQSVAWLQEALRETAAALATQIVKALDDDAGCSHVFGAPDSPFKCRPCQVQIVIGLLDTAYAALALPVEPEKHRLCIDPYCVECQGRRMLPVIDAPRTLVETRPPEPATESVEPKPVLVDYSTHAFEQLTEGIAGLPWSTTVDTCKHCFKGRAAHTAASPEPDPTALKKPFGTCGKSGHRGCLDSRGVCGHDNMDRMKAASPEPAKEPNR